MTDPNLMVKGSGDPIHWGVISTGTIAGTLAQAIVDQPDAVLLGVGSRSQESANAFGDRWRIPRRYSSYKALVDDPDVEVVYIGTPHPFHAENARLCLEHGKHVLLEKPFTLNAHEAEDLIGLARDKKLFLMEAMWTRYLPTLVQTRAWLEQGVIGEVRLIRADFTFRSNEGPEHRVFDPVLGGGALLDIGIYPLSLAVMILGIPHAMKSHVHIGPTGVDELNAVLMSYSSGATAVFTSSQRLDAPIEAEIIGTEGYIKLPDRFFYGKQVTLKVGDKSQTFNLPYDSNGCIHQIREVHACLRSGKLESAVMPLDETLAIMQLMDTLREEWDLTYPGESL